MILSQVECREYDIPFVTPLITAKGVINSRRGLIVRGLSSDGRIGYGEIAPLEGISSETLIEARQALVAITPTLQGCEIPAIATTLPELIDVLFTDIPRHPSLVYGVETMLADLSSQESGVSLSRWFSPTSTPAVPVNAILSGSLTEVTGQLRRKSDSGFYAFKLKVGVESLGEELEKIATIRKLVGGKATIRLDANGAFNFEQATAFLSQVGQYDIEYIEDPLPFQYIDRLEELKRRCRIPVAADAGVKSLLRQDNCVCDVVILKPTIVGGIRRSLELSRLAASQGIKTVISSTLETGIGLTASLHLAVILSDNILPCGLDTLDLLSDTLIREPLEVRDGYLQVPTDAGLGAACSDFAGNRCLTRVEL